MIASPAPADAPARANPVSPPTAEGYGAAPVVESVPALPPEAPSHLLGRAVLLLMGVGIWFRLAQYLGNRALWLDEAFLVPTVVERSFREILSPSSFGAVPIGFQLATRALVSVLGSSEYVLRLVPLVAGIASLFLFLAVARRCLSQRAVPFALALFAFSPYLIYYASEFKPYALDVTVTLLLLLGALEVRRRGLSWVGAALAFVAAPVAVFFSLPAVFVLGGATLTLICAALRERDRGLLPKLLAVAGGWAVLFGVPALFLMSSAGPKGGEAAYLQAFWRDGFMPFPPRSLQDLGWFPKTLTAVFRDPLGVLTEEQSAKGFFQAAAGMFACLVGVLWMASRRRFAFALLATPIALALIGSGLKLYPFGGGWVTSGRLILYTAPLFFLLMGEGIEQLRRTPSPGVRNAAWVVLALALLPSLLQTVLVFPSGRTEIRPLLTYVKQHWQPGDVLYVHYDSRQTFHYYGPRLGFTPGEYRLGECSRFAPEKYLQELDQLRGRRVWLVFSGGRGAHGFNESAFMLDYLDHVGTRLDARVATGASLYRYDLPSTAPSHRMQIPRIPFAIEHGCALWGGAPENPNA